MVPRKPIWVCEVCKKVIVLDGDVSFDLAEYSQYSEELAEWEFKHTQLWGGHRFTVASGLDLARYPEPIRFRVRHYDCYTWKGEYSIDIHDNLETWSDVVDESVHLHSKSWFKHSDWRGLMTSAGLFGENSMPLRPSA